MSQAELSRVLRSFILMVVELKEKDGQRLARTTMTNEVAHNWKLGHLKDEEKVREKDEPSGMRRLIEIVN